jgi:hypothetical protein
MKTERVLQILIAFMVTLSAIMLGVSQKSVSLPIMVTFVAMTSLLFTDILHWFHLNRIVANVAAVVALFISFWDFFESDSQQQLKAIANLLVYLQVVLFYQSKYHRIYWQLAVLSLLQVVVGAAMSVGVEFGVLLVIYMTAAFSALAVFYVHRQIDRMVTQAKRPKHIGLEKTGSHASLLNSTPIAYTDADEKLLSSALLEWGFFRQVGALGITTLVFAMVLFYSVPRQIVNGSLREGHGGGQTQVGFSPRVGFDNPRSLTQNNSPVLRVSYIDPETGEPYAVQSDLYLRGAVWTSYDATKERWIADPFAQQIKERMSYMLPHPHSQHSHHERRLSPPPKWRPHIVQKAVLLPNRRASIFAPFPVFALRETAEEIHLDPNSGQLHRPMHRVRTANQKYEYVVATTAFNAGIQSSISPHEFSYDSLYNKLEIWNEERDICARMSTSGDNANRFKRLTEIAAEVVRREPPGRDRVRMANAIATHFRYSGEYEYTLDLDEIPRDPDLDPIEDFVTNHKMGHCQYFASALTLMLRSQQIPARLVVGYAGGEYNSVGNYYQFRQRDAHAWVEVLLTPEEADPYLLPGQQIKKAPAYWLRLDPTPPARDDDHGGDADGLMAKFDDAMDLAQILWSDYVLGLDSSRQKESIFDVADQTSIAFFDMLEPEFGVDTKTIIMIVLVIVGLSIGIRPMTVWWQEWRSFKRKKKTAQRRNAERKKTLIFYERMEHLLGMAGVQRSQSMTQREFVAHVGQWWDLVATGEEPAIPVPPTKDELFSLVEQITTTFYSVRFGGATLDKDGQKSIEHALQRIQNLLNSLTKRPTPTV